MILKRIICFFLSLVLLLFLSACSSIYIPSMPSLPLLEEKGDAQIEFSASTNSLRLSGNYAFSDKYAVIVNSYLSYKNFTNHYDIFTKEDSDRESIFFVTNYGEFANKYAEIGIGRYNIIQKDSLARKRFKFEIITGMGYGHATDQKWGTPLQYEAKYYLGYVQPNIGLTINTFEFGMGLRLASSFYDYRYQTYSSNSGQNKEILSQNTKFTMFLVEQMVMLRFGGENFKFVLQGGVSLPFTLQSLDGINPEWGIIDGNVNSTYVHFSIGINYKFGSRKKK